MGYRADVASNGIEALQALKRQTYDVVLMDIQMPEMDGEQATLRIREDWPTNRQPRIIAMTAHAMVGAREKYLAAGMDDYVSKPVVRIEQLAEALGRCQSLSDIPLEKNKFIDRPSSVQLVEKTPAEIVDLSMLEQSLGESSAESMTVISELVDVFLSDIDEILKELNQSIEEEDPKKLKRAAHTLKGGSALFGANVLSKLCFELEQMDLIEMHDSVLQQISRIEEECERVRIALNGMCQKMT